MKQEDVSSVEKSLGSIAVPQRPAATEDDLMLLLGITSDNVDEVTLKKPRVRDITRGLWNPLHNFSKDTLGGEGAYFLHDTPPEIGVTGDQDNGITYQYEPEALAQFENPEYEEPHNEVLVIADALRAISNIYLASTEGNRAIDAFSIESYEYGSTTIRLILPLYFRYAIVAGISDDVVFLDKSARSFDRDNFSVEVNVHVGDMEVLEAISAEGIADASQSPTLRRYVAARLTVELLNYAISPGATFKLDVKKFSPRYRDADTVFDLLGKCIIEGKVKSCPICHKSFIKRRKTSMPFCKKSHQIRYREKAMALFAKGASVDEVYERFPFIKRETINCWTR